MALCDETKQQLQSVALMHFIFTMEQNRDNRPQNTCVSSDKYGFFSFYHFTITAPIGGKGTFNHT